MAFGERKEITIGSNTFWLMAMPPFKAIAVKAKVAKAFLAPLTKIVKPNGNGGVELNVENIALALSEADPALIESVMQDLLNGEYISISVDGAKPKKLEMGHINQIFTGNLSEMYKLAYEVIKVNYGDFLDLLTNTGAVE